MDQGEIILLSSDCMRIASPLDRTLMRTGGFRSAPLSRGLQHAQASTWRLATLGISRAHLGCLSAATPMFTTLAQEDISAIDLKSPPHILVTPSQERVHLPAAASSRSAGSEHG